MTFQSSCARLTIPRRPATAEARHHGHPRRRTDLGQARVWRLFGFVKGERDA